MSHLYASPDWLIVTHLSPSVSSTLILSLKSVSIVLVFDGCFCPPDMFQISPSLFDLPVHETDLAPVLPADVLFSLDELQIRLHLIWAQVVSTHSRASRGTINPPPPPSDRFPLVFTSRSSFGRPWTSAFLTVGGCEEPSGSVYWDKELLEMEPIISTPPSAWLSD